MMNPRNTHAVRLRAMEPNDVDMMYELENDPGLWACSGTTSPYSRHSLCRYVESNSNDIYQDRQLRLTIEADGQPAGCADLFHFDPINRRAEAGIAILQKWRGNGVAHEAISQLLDFSQRHLALIQLYAVVACSNTHAIRLFTACGFRQTAVLPSWLVKEGRTEDAVLFQCIM